MEPYTKNTYRYNWRNTDSTRNNIRKSLGLPIFPTRKWSSETYSPASASNGTSGSMSEFTDDDSVDDPAEEHEHNAATDAELASKILEVVVMFLLVGFSSLGGPGTTLIACAIIFLYDRIRSRYLAERLHLEAQHTKESNQKQKDNAREIQLLLDTIRSTILIEQFKTMIPMPERLEIMHDNYDLLRDSLLSLRDHLHTGSLVKGSEEREEYFKLRDLFDRSHHGGWGRRESNGEPFKIGRGFEWNC